MKNFVQDGKIIEYANAGSAILSGAVVAISGIGCGVALQDIAATTGVGSVAFEGIYSIPKVAGAVSFGARVYWNGTAATTTASTNTLIGFCAKAALSGDANVIVKLMVLGDTDPGQLTQAAFVAPLGSTSNLVGVDGTGSNAAPVVGTESRLDAIEAKVDAALASLVAAGLMAAS